MVSISIPIFSGQLEHSKEAVDLANMRNAYALISVDAIVGDATTNKLLYYDLSGNLVEEKPTAYGKGTPRNGNTIWGGCSDYTYNPEADYTGSVIDVWYDGNVVHVHWDNAASGSPGSSSGSQPGAGSGSGTSSGTSGGQGTNTGDGSGSSSKPSGGAESGSGTGVGGAGGSTSSSPSEGETPSGPTGSEVLNSQTAMNYPDQPTNENVAQIFQGERYTYNGEVYIVTATPQQFNQYYYATPDSGTVGWLFAKPTGRLLSDSNLNSNNQLPDLKRGDIYIVSAD